VAWAQVKSVAYDLDFPPEIFDDWMKSTPREFRADPFGSPPKGQPTPDLFLPEDRRRSEAYATPPPDFDLSQARLRFQFPPGYDPNQEHRLPNSVMELFSGPYFLGRLLFPDPFLVTCARSPDGRLLAFASLPWVLDKASTPLSLANLDLLSPELSIPAQLDGVTPNVMAFAPDSRRLAVATYPQGERASSVFVWDTSTWEVDTLLENIQAASLGWSRDGQYLAVTIEKGAGAAYDQVAILEVATRKIVMWEKIGPTGGVEVSPIFQALQKLGIKKWISRGNLENCMLPGP
jgi:hypothetical protein